MIAQMQIIHKTDRITTDMVLEAQYTTEQIQPMHSTSWMQKVKAHE